MAARQVDRRFPDRLRELLAASGLTYRALAARTYYSKSHLHDLASGHTTPTVEAAERLDRALGGQGELIDLATAATTVPAPQREPLGPSNPGAVDHLRQYLVAGGDPTDELAPPPVRQLQQIVSTAHDLYQRARYADSANLLPRALQGADQHIRAGTPDTLAVYRVLALANVAASKIAAKVGDAGLAWLAADRAAQAARSADDATLRAPWPPTRSPVRW
jgi:transcriptional regulator with XRE-family HTH domain